MSVELGEEVSGFAFDWPSRTTVRLAVFLRQNRLVMIWGHVGMEGNGEGCMSEDRFKGAVKVSRACLGESFATLNLT